MNVPFRLILNGSEPDRNETARFIQALTDPDKLKSAGGYLFKTCLTENTVHINIIPAISEGERLHHYDIEVPDTNFIIGTVSARGEFTLLFQTEKNDLNDERRKAWKSRFSAFAAVLYAMGYNGKGDLDWISRQIIGETGLFCPVPETLDDIKVQYGTKSGK